MEDGNSSVHTMGIHGIPNSMPSRWNFSHKKVEDRTKSYQTIGKSGFLYLCKDSEIIDRLGDTVRRHYSSKSSEYQVWRPSIRTTPALIAYSPIEKPSRVKPVELKSTNNEREVIRRGKAMIPIQREREGQEIGFLLGGIKKVCDENGNKLSEKRGIEVPFESTIQRKKRIETDTQPENLGAALFEKEKTNTYFLKPIIPETLSAYDPRTTALEANFIARKKEIEAQKQVKKDIELVKNLDNWLPPAIKEQLEKEKKEELRTLEQQKQKQGSNKKTGNTHNNKNNRNNNNRGK